MPNQTDLLLAALLVFTAGCPAAPADDPPEQAPDPIGDELIRHTGTWAYYTCAISQFHREGRLVQHLCFFSDGLFSYENLGTLTAEASAALDAAQANADFDDREPVNHMGLCGASDSQGTVTMWAGDRSVEFAPSCLFEGIVALYEEIVAIQNELGDCGQWADKFESFEPGCRSI